MKSVGANEVCTTFTPFHRIVSACHLNGIMAGDAGCGRFVAILPAIVHTRVVELHWMMIVLCPFLFRTLRGVTQDAAYI
jgi:hypothetical protein